MTTKSHKTTPADKVEQWPIEKLVPYAKNSRTHSEEQVAQIAASISFTLVVISLSPFQVSQDHAICDGTRGRDNQLAICQLPRRINTVVPNGAIHLHLHRTPRI